MGESVEEVKREFIFHGDRNLGVSADKDFPGVLVIKSDAAADSFLISDDLLSVTRPKKC